MAAVWRNEPCTYSGHNQDMPPVSNRQDARRRAERAHQLRALGRTWQEIADSLGYRSRGSAQDAVARLLTRSAPESPEALRRVEAEELRIRRAVLHERFHAARARQDDDALVALNRELDRISTRVSKLHGLDAPERQQVDLNLATDPAAIIAETRDRLLAVLAEREQRQLTTAPILEAEVVECP